jgi:hypothetical protein
MEWRVVVVGSEEDEGSVPSVWKVPGEMNSVSFSGRLVFGRVGCTSFLRQQPCTTIHDVDSGHKKLFSAFSSFLSLHRIALDVRERERES